MDEQINQTKPNQTGLLCGVCCDVSEQPISPISEAQNVGK